ncbi:MAG TPA: pyruvate ferredoxin oxidoreductase subunit gamma [Dehalococcoidales bacterium]|nr:pyruvate ferredoxin oxidoreductase subunit gamma [Dehalococcoidales bacterium]
MIDLTKIIEIRWHGRGGQGAVTSAELVAKAAISEDKYAQAFPSFGPERRGAPVLAFNRVSSKERIRVRAEVEEPDIVIVLDPGLLAIVDVTAGIKKDGIIIVNTIKNATAIKQILGTDYLVATVDANKIAMEQLGVPIVNTTMAGALLKVTDIVKMESMIEPLKERFGRLAERNIKAMEKAYQETKMGDE